MQLALYMYAHVNKELKKKTKQKAKDKKKRQQECKTKSGRVLEIPHSLTFSVPDLIRDRMYQFSLRLEYEGKTTYFVQNVVVQRSTRAHTHSQNTQNSHTHAHTLKARRQPAAQRRGGGRGHVSH